MKRIKNMTQIELAAFVHSSLREHGVDVVLSGGASVTLYSGNKYVSKDLDLINVRLVKRRKIKAVMEELGFLERGRHFVHPDSDFTVEFPDGPLSVGEEPVKKVDEIALSTGNLRVISPTDCVKDRLAAYYFWGDQQCLAQAVMVAAENKIDLKEVERWSKAEGKFKEFQTFKSRAR
ncbi:MAG: hypothetical protein AB1750_01245 [Chloroflexota bacterium]